MTVIEAVRGDLTKQRVDAIVNAANSSLLGGGGVDGAIHLAGGPQILEACMALRRSTYPDGLPTGDAVATIGGSLPARWVIHTVGPVYGRHAGYESALLAACHTNTLEVARGLGARSVAFPAISCGVFGYPVQEAAPVAVAAVGEFVAAHPGAFDVVRFALMSERVHDAFAAELTASA